MPQVSIASLFVSVLSSIVLMLFTVAPAYADEFGFSSAAFSAGSDGQANYGISIQVPPGIGGIQPQLSINYDSGSDNDLMGVGWNLGGISSIERCGQSIATDGTNLGVYHEDSDRFCLDGLRLIKTSLGRYGAGQVEYRTEVETFTKVVSRGSARPGTALAFMPEMFEVYANDGRIMEFGSLDPNDKSRVTLPDGYNIQRWMLRMVRDRFGNTMEYHYFHRGNGEFKEEFLPRSITYTSNPAQGTAAFARVDFDYERKSNNFDNVRRMLAGGSFRNYHRLKSIKTFDRSRPVREYRFYYDNQGVGYVANSVGGQSRLIRVQECGNGSCLPATQIRYNGASPDWRGSGGFNGLSYETTAENPQLQGDFNGDGRTDVARVVTNSVAVRVSTGSGFANYGSDLPDFGKNSAPDSNKFPIFTGDFDGDGRTDIGRVYQNEIRFKRATGSGWQALPSITNGLARTHGYENNYKFPLITGDFNGDGRTDVARFGPNGVETRLYHPSGWRGYPVLRDFQQGAGFPHSNQNPTFTGDFNGDGRTDIGRVGATEVRIYLSTDRGFVRYQGNLANQFAINSGYFDGSRFPIFTGDFNNDGLTDLGRVASTSVRVLLSTGRGWVRFNDLPDFGSNNYSNSLAFPVVIGDYNGDGRDDIGRLHPQDGMRIYASNGFGWNGIKSLAGVTRGFSPVTKHPIVGGADFNGDGVADFARFDSNGMRVWQQTAQASRVNRIIDGWGKELKFEYRLMSDRTVYKPGADVAWPLKNAMPAQYLLSSVQRTSGERNGAPAIWSYEYKGLRIRHDRREGPGFAETTTTDRTRRNDQFTGLKTWTAFNQDFPYLGQPRHSITWQMEGNAKVSESKQTHRRIRHDHPDQATTWFPYLASEQVSEHEPAAGGRLVRRVQTDWNYGGHGNTGVNYGQPTLIVEKVLSPSSALIHTTTTALQYWTNPAEWLLNRVKRESTYRKREGGDSRAHVTDFQWRNGSHRIKHVIREPDRISDKLVTSFLYDGHGNRTRSTVSGAGVEARETNVLYLGTSGHIKGRFPTWSKNAAGHTSTHAYESRCGARRQSIDANGLVVRWEYDALCRQTREVRPDQTWTRASYNVNTPTRFKMTVQSSGSPWRRTVYDELKRPIRSVQQSFDNREVLVDSWYDYQGRLTDQSRPYFSGENTYWYQYRYDPLGRNTRMSEPGPGGTSLISKYRYDGLTTTATDPKQKSTQWQRNMLGQLFEVRDHNHIGGNASMRYAYDADGNLLRTADVKGNSIRLSYDRLGRKVSMKDPDMGFWRYNYDVLGQLVSQVDGRGKRISLAYDRLGRIIRRNTEEGTSNWRWDSAIKGIGRLAQASSPGYNRWHSYDNYGRANQTRIQVGNTDMTARLNFDGQGRVNQRFYPGPGLVVQNQYNAQGYLQGLYSSTTGKQLWRATGVNAAGQLSRQRFGNGLRTDTTFDSGTGDMTRVLTGPDSALGAAQNLAYTWDEVGNLLTREDRNGNVRASERFEYDDLYRLTATVTNTSAGSSRIDVRYDAIGNITWKSDVGSYRYGPINNRPHAVVAVDTSTARNRNASAFNPAGNYQYNGNGALVSGAGRNVSWTSFNMPKSISGNGQNMQMLYGPEFQRVRKTESGNSDTVYFNKIYEQNTVNGVVTHKHYISAGSATIEIHKTGNQWWDTRYLHNDHIGSPTAITDQSGRVIERLSFDPWGQRRNANWTIGTGAASRSTRGFTGHEMDDKLGLINMNARIYDPLLGRFLSPDDIIPYATNLQAYNRYSYVHNNPLAFTDPSGHIATGGSSEMSSIAGSSSSSGGVVTVTVTTDSILDDDDIEGSCGSCDRAISVFSIPPNSPVTTTDCECSEGESVTDENSTTGDGSDGTITTSDGSSGTPADGSDSGDSDSGDSDTDQMPDTSNQVACPVCPAIIFAVVRTAHLAKKAREAKRATDAAKKAMNARDKWNPPSAPKGGGRSSFPQIDSTGKMHGRLPDIKDVKRNLNKNAMRDLRDDLRQSLKQRSRVNKRKGAEPGHSRRETQEANLEKSLTKHLEN